MALRASQDSLREALYRRGLGSGAGAKASDGWRAVDSCVSAEVGAAPGVDSSDEAHLARFLSQIGREESLAQTAWALKKRDQRAYFSFLGRHPEVHAQQVQARDGWRDGLPQVLMVAEKPSVARMVAEFLNQGSRLRERRGVCGPCPIFEFAAVFPPTGQKSIICVTSVIGHLFELTFDGSPPGKLEDMYNSPVVKNVTESARKARVPEHLQDLL